jgi:hypothetical protein
MTEEYFSRKIPCARGDARSKLRSASRPVKIGILTFHFSDNFGAVLQCYCLQSALRALGVEVEVVDYHPPSLHRRFWQGWGVREGKFFERVTEQTLRFRHGRAAHAVFEEFRSRHLRLSARCASAREVAAVVANYDAIITGSDQVWNNLRDPVYFLEWEAPFHGKRISYAACCSVENPVSASLPGVGTWLRRIEALSVRNEVSRRVVERLCGRQAEIVADPTVLADIPPFDEVIQLPPDDFILTYLLGSEIPGGHLPMLQAIRRAVGNLPIVAVVLGNANPQSATWADRVVWSASPACWLGLFRRASFVYTDSFHAVVYAARLARPFIAYYSEPWRAARLLDLGHRYGLKDCIHDSSVQADQKVDLALRLNPGPVLRLMDTHRYASRNFLRVAIKD